MRSWLAGLAILMLGCGGAAGGADGSPPAPCSAELPPQLREYFTASCGLGGASAHANHPDLEAQLADPSTRTCVVWWLGSARAHDVAHENVAAGALVYVAARAQPSEVSVARSFTRHRATHVRSGAWRWILTAYYPKELAEVMRALDAMEQDSDASIRDEARAMRKGLAAGK